MTDGGLMIQVEKGNPDAEELAALTVVLLALARETDSAELEPNPAAWRRPERAHGFCAPHSWQAVPVHLHRPRSAHARPVHV